MAGDSGRSSCSIDETDADEEFENLGVEKLIPFQNPVAAPAKRLGIAFRWLV
jgi:hypothetical protein